MNHWILEVFKRKWGPKRKRRATSRQDDDVPLASALQRKHQNFEVLGLASCHPEEWKIAGTSSWPSWISHFTGSFVGHSPSEMLCPPAVKSKAQNQSKTIRKDPVIPRVTHTRLPRGGKVLSSVPQVG